MNKLYIQSAVGFLALLSLTSAVAVASDDDTAAPTYKVRFGDLDLDTAAGNKQLYSRIRLGAESVCRTSEGKDLGSVAKHKRCMENAVADAVAKIDKPRLTAFYVSQHGGQPPLAVSSSAGPSVAKRSVTVR